jgi:hypothetical protein
MGRFVCTNPASVRVGSVRSLGRGCILQMGDVLARAFWRTTAKGEVWQVCWFDSFYQ